MWIFVSIVEVETVTFLKILLLLASLQKTWCPSQNLPRKSASKSPLNDQFNIRTRGLWRRSQAKFKSSLNLQPIASPQNGQWGQLLRCRILNGDHSRKNPQRKVCSVIVCQVCLLFFFGSVVGADNPYLKFFQRRPDRAAVWRELPPLSLDEMNLTQKAEAITEMVGN